SPRMHVFMYESNLVGCLENLKREIQSVRDSFIVTMPCRIQFHMFSTILHLFGRPRLIRQNSAFDDPGVRSLTQKESALMRQDGICGPGGARLPDSFELGMTEFRSRRLECLCLLEIDLWSIVGKISGARRRNAGSRSLEDQQDRDECQH